MKGFINTARDRDNLQFLMACDTESLQEWFEHTGTDDLDYAWELLTAYGRELNEQVRELRVEVQLEVSGSDPSVEQLIRNIAQ